MSRPDVVLTLVDMDLATLVTAMESGDRSLIRMRDGSTPTTEQLGWILSATVEDLDAANDMWKLHLEQVQHELDRQVRLDALVEKYHRDGDTGKVSLLTIANRMTPEDRAEWDRLWDELGNVIPVKRGAE